MPGTIVLKLPENILLEALRQLSPLERRRLLQELGRDDTPSLKGVSAVTLDAWAGAIAVGGDALLESEQLYDN